MDVPQVARRFTRMLLALPGIGLAIASYASDAQPVQVSLASGPVHVLRELTHLVRPTTAPANRVCRATTGDSATVLESVATDSSPVVWVRVRFVSGACKDLEGWVASDALRVD